MKKNIIVLSIVSLFVLIGTLPATADWTLDATTTNVLYGANSASTYQVAASGPLEYTLTAAETLSNSYFVTFNLLGGAVFSSNTTVTKLPVTLTPASATLVYLSGGLPGETSIKYIISSVTAATPGTVIQFGVNNAAKLLNVSSLGVNSNVGASISIQNAANAPITTDRTLNAAGKRYVYTCVPLFVVSNNSGQNTVDVNATGGPFTRFIGNSLVSSANSSGLKIGNYGIGIPDQQLQKKKAIITLEGDFSGISKVTFTNANYGWIGCDASGTTTNGTLGQFLIDSTKTKAYVTNNELVPAGDNNANLGVTTDVIFLS